MIAKNFQLHRYCLRDLASCRNAEDLHILQVYEALKRYSRLCDRRGVSLGSVLVTCAGWGDARWLKPWPFGLIVLTGLGAPSDQLLEAMEEDSRFSYWDNDAENLSPLRSSFDLVFCKAGLHHLPKPVQGLYEMLRTCRRAAIFIEPADTTLRRILVALRLASEFERDVKFNIGGGDNYVFPWSLAGLKHILSSYYGNSGYRADVTLGWTSHRLFAKAPRPIQILSALTGWAINFVPGCAGNTFSAMIVRKAKQ